MRAQGFALSKMKGDSKSAKFKIWDTQHKRYVQWLVDNNTIIRSFVWICYFAETGFSVVKGAIVFFFNDSQNGFWRILAYR